MTITTKLLVSLSAAALAAGGMAEAATTSTTVQTKTTVTTTRTASGHHRTHRVRRVAHRSRHGSVRQATATRTTTTTTTTRTDSASAAPGTYYANRDYRDGPQYQERTLTAQDRVYAGEDGRYYCRRPDGTTGLIVGGAAGALLGNVIAKGSSSTLGTILGAGAGALAGRAVEQRTVRCR